MDVFRDNGPVNKIQVYGKVDGESFLEYSVSDPNARGLQVITYVESFQHITNIDHLRELAEKLAEEKFAKIDISKISKVDRKDWHILPDDYKPIDEIKLIEPKKSSSTIESLMCISLVFFPILTIWLFIIIGFAVGWLVFTIVGFFLGMLILNEIKDIREETKPTTKSPYDDFLNPLKENVKVVAKEYREGIIQMGKELDNFVRIGHHADYNLKMSDIKCDHDWEKITSVGGEFKIHLCRKCGKTKDSKIDVSKMKATRYCSYCGVKLPKSVGECPYCGKIKVKNSDWTKKALKPARRPI